MIYRQPEEDDFAAMQALELETLRAEDHAFDNLPERERVARVRTTLASLRHYARSGHSFVAATKPVAAGSAVVAFVLAQALWEGDRASVHIASLRAHPDAAPGALQGLLRAVIKSAYDSGAYEVHLPAGAAAVRAAELEGFKPVPWRAMLRVMGSRSQAS